MPYNKDTEITALHLATSQNPNVQPARQRRSVKQSTNNPVRTETIQTPQTSGEADVRPLKGTVVGKETLPAILNLESVVKVYGTGPRQVAVLRGTNLCIEKGQIVGLFGPSGSGKSTLLQVSGLLDNPTSGHIQIGDLSVETLGDYQRTQIRRDTIGFVYQFHHLLKEFSAVENVMMPQRIAGVSAKHARARAVDLLTRVGLQERLHHRPAKLSGGEQQRVAIARSLANRPALLLADEPTGNLDPETAEIVFELLLALTRQEGMAALIATHNRDLGARMDRCVNLVNGFLHEL